MAVDGDDGGGGRIETRPVTPEARRPSRLRRPTSRVLQMQSTLAWQAEQDAMNTRPNEMENEGAAQLKAAVVGVANVQILVAVQQLTAVVLAQESRMKTMEKHLTDIQERQREMREQQRKIQEQYHTTQEQLCETRNEVKRLHSWIKENAPTRSQPPTATGSPNLSNITWPSLPTSEQPGYV